MVKKIIISIHDISPIYEKELELIYSQLKKLNVKKKEGLVVLNWCNKFPIDKNKFFSNKILQEFNKDAITFHGITHYSKNKTFWNRLLFGKQHSYTEELIGLDKVKLDSYLRDGVNMYYKIFKFYPEKIIQARWKNSKILRNNLKNLNFKYTEDGLYIINLKKDIYFFSPILCFDYGNNIILNKLARIYSWIIIFISIILKKPVRFSIHPNDVKNNNFNFEIKLLKKMLKNGWEEVYSKDLFLDKK